MSPYYEKSCLFHWFWTKTVSWLVKTVSLSWLKQFLDNRNLLPGTPGYVGQFSWDDESKLSVPPRYVSGTPGCAEHLGQDLSAPLASKFDCISRFDCNFFFLIYLLATSNCIQEDIQPQHQQQQDCSDSPAARTIMSNSICNRNFEIQWTCGGENHSTKLGSGWHWIIPSQLFKCGSLDRTSWSLIGSGHTIR